MQCLGVYFFMSYMMLSELHKLSVFFVPFFLFFTNIEVPLTTISPTDFPLYTIPYM